MELETLSCNNCGAPLQVPITANFVNCAYCGSRLAVKRTESAHYTEVLERLDRLDTRTESVEAAVRVLQLDKAIMELDDGWRAKRKQYMMQGRDGTLHAPGLGRIAFYVTVLVVVLIASPIIIATNPDLNRIAGASGPFIFVLLLLALTVGVFWVSIDEYRNYRRYQTLQASYQARRNALLNERQQAELSAAKGGA
jgi:DNA-directed RNA polymerase subunit RPC12/RpoP